MGTDTLIAVAGIEAAVLVLVLMLTIVDDDMVRFMTIAGQGSWRIVARHGRGALLFVAMAAPVCALAFGRVVASIVAAAATAALLLMAIRILAYRIHAKRFADFIVSMLTALLILVACSIPVILPLVAIAILWRLQRRAAARTWLLA